MRKGKIRPHLFGPAFDTAFDFLPAVESSIVILMGRIASLLFVLSLAGVGVVPSCFAATPVSLEAGYVTTDHDKYGDGFVYGLTIRDGDRRLALGVTIKWFDNTLSWTSYPDTISNTPFRNEERFDIFSVTVLAYYSLFELDSVNQLMLGAGPQVHFVTARWTRITGGFSEANRESRLGFAAVLRYERIVQMFGELRFTLDGSYSYMEGTYEKVDVYQPPLESAHIFTFMAGLGYPF